MIFFECSILAEGNFPVNEEGEKGKRCVDGEYPGLFSCFSAEGVDGKRKYVGRSWKDRIFFVKVIVQKNEQPIFLV